MNLTGMCPLTTHDALERAAALAPDLEAVVTSRARVTYRQLRDDVAVVRSAFAASGVRPGDRVAICLGNGPRWVTLFLALGSLGAVVVPINTRFTAQEIGYTLAQSRARLLIVAERFLKIDFVELIRECCAGIDTGLPDPALPELSEIVVIGERVPAAARGWDKFLAAADSRLPARCGPDDPLLIQYTSGTTARPKGALLTHRGMCANGYFSAVRMGLRTGDRFHSARPFFHVAGSTLSVLSSIQSAATLITMDRFDAGEALRLMEVERCTHFSGNDTIALMLLNHPDRPRKRLKLRGGWVAASAVIVRQVIDELGARECVAGYGLSEASPNVAQSAWWEDETVRATSLMRPQPGVEVRIQDPDGGEQCRPGDVGEILVRGWNVMLGYFEMPEETAAVLTDDGWLSTGDLGRLDADGRLEFVGRSKELIRVGGENVSPSEIEDVLHAHPGVAQAAVVGVADARLMEIPFAFVVPVEGHRLDPDELARWVAQRLARFKVPHHIRIISDFASIGMTASSKVPKRSLASHAEALLAGTSR